jgi:hypothetical protein
MRNKDKIELILLIIFMIIIPFCISMWGLVSSGALNEFYSIISSSNKKLGSFLLCFLWIMGMGMASEFIRQSQKRSEHSKDSA